MGGRVVIKGNKEKGGSKDGDNLIWGNKEIGGDYWRGPMDNGGLIRKKGGASLDGNYILW